VEPERQYSGGHEAVTDLVDISINLSDKIENDLGEMKVGDEKDFSIAVRVLCGYRPKNDCETATVGTSCLQLSTRACRVASELGESRIGIFRRRCIMTFVGSPWTYA
jgi:hypothetical protein